MSRLNKGRSGEDEETPGKIKKGGGREEEALGRWGGGISKVEHRPKFPPIHTRVMMSSDLIAIISECTCWRVRAPTL